MGDKTHKKVKGIDLMQEVYERQARDAQQLAADNERKRKDPKKPSA